MTKLMSALLLSCLAVVLGACGDDNGDKSGGPLGSVPFGADVTDIAPAIAHTGVGLSLASGVAQDFSTPVIHTVTAANASTQQYIVHVNQGASTVTEPNTTYYMRAWCPESELLRELRTQDTSRRLNR